MTLEIRRLTPDDADALFAVRVRALATDPVAFTAEQSQEEALGVPFFRERLGQPLDQAATFGAWEDGALVGMVGLFRPDRPKGWHKVMVWGMWVAPEARQHGVGRGLLAAALAFARAMPDCARVKLSVNTGQLAAVRLYQSMGFEVTGTEPDALRWEGVSYDEHHMERVL
ncbi:MAG: GNAT family N-acetyltransferase [Alphaproteobacteria bacterium]|nr:GNAT family N-acetyltransferase [Alphaproteobacteria bacterium]